MELVIETHFSLFPTLFDEITNIGASPLLCIDQFLMKLSYLWNWTKKKNSGVKAGEISASSPIVVCLKQPHIIIEQTSI